MTRKERLRRILAGVFCFSLVFTIAFTWGYVKFAVPDRLNLVVSEEEIFHFTLPPGVTLESDSEEVVLGNASNIPAERSGSRPQSRCPCMAHLKEATTWE